MAVGDIELELREMRAARRVRERTVACMHINNNGKLQGKNSSNFSEFRAGPTLQIQFCAALRRASLYVMWCGTTPPRFSATAARSAFSGLLAAHVR